MSELRAVPLATLEKHLGRRAATSFHNQALGIASEKVVSGQGRKSISKETTFEADVLDQHVLHHVLRDLAAEVTATARRKQLFGSVVTLKIRFAGFETYTRRRRLATATHDERVVLREAWSLFLHGGLPCRPVRLIGVGISDWKESATVQADLFDQPDKRLRDERLLKTLDRASERFGKGVLRLGFRMSERK